MGTLLSVLQSLNRIIFSNTSGSPLEQLPISYLRQDDYSVCGTLREGCQDKWSSAIHSMIFLDLNTRHALWPIIQRRMDRMEASLRYTNCSLGELKQDLGGWDNKRIFEAHDLFQAFEVDGDGLIEIAEMSVGLDNLGDKTPMKERIALLCSQDEDGTGSIDFEEFLQILYTQKPNSSLSKTFVGVNDSVKFIRWMSTIQQIKAGLL